MRASVKLTVANSDAAYFSAAEMAAEKWLASGLAFAVIID